MLHLFLFCLLFGVWFVFSGKTEPFFLVTGALSALFSVYLADRMGFVKKYKFIPSAPKYWLWMVKEICTSTLKVSKMVWSVKPKLSPKMITYPMNFKNDRAYAIMANSITLTPGTVTIYVFYDRMVVHTLDSKNAEDLHKSEMYKKVTKTYG